MGDARRLQPAVRVSILWLALFVTTCGITLLMSEGHFVYTLDDPYIHLAVAENIIDGGYGINPGEYASPSSSIAWPWMLAGTLLAGAGASGPLVLNAVAAGLSVYLSARLLSARGMLNDSTPPVLFWLTSILLILCLSAIALPLTGMEHSWHVLTVVVVFTGLVSISDGDKPSVAFILAIILMPLLRFEGMALSGVTIIALAFTGHRKQAFCASLAIALLLGAYAGLMSAYSLPMLPSSVQVKSALATSSMDGAGIMAALKGNIVAHFSSHYMLIYLIAFAILMACNIWCYRTMPGKLIIFLPVTAALVAHVMGGRNGWFYRYEVYVIALISLAVFYAASLKIAKDTNDNTDIGKERWPQQAALVFCLLPALLYTVATVLSPYASRNIYEQQYQLHRFLVDYYRGPVAVNDLGLMSYDNENHVLDLWGLGSEEARRLRLAGHYGAKELRQLVDNQKVGLVIIYDSWFPEKPAEWRKVAILHNLEMITAADDEVAFYATPAGNTSLILEQLEAFRPTLPARVQLEIRR